MDWPNLCLMLLTYNRLEFAERTLRSALDLMRYSGRTMVHIADDGSGDDYRRRLIELAGGYGHVASVGVTDSNRQGYGANYNLATQEIHQHSKLIFPLEDDWQLLRRLDLDPFASALAEGKFGCIRLGYLGLTQPLRGEVVIAGQNLWLLLDSDSPERHVFAGHPRLETVDWEKAVGPWPEGLTPNMTEFEVAAFKKARHGVVWPLDFVLAHGDLFAHIGAYEAGDGRNFPKEAVPA